ncbi:MAG TPA: hypothetical protein VFL36_01105 [Myxococcales bacterium]|nr:hypothetical protein [Myxococcales bacterium]
MLLAAALQACSLLTSTEIAAVQREAPAEKREAASKRGELDVAQCFYVLPTFARSVSLEVARGDVAALLERARAPRGEKADGKDAEEQALLRVRALGDEAFWAGSARLGGLYVRRGDLLLRLAVGGPESRAAKLAKLRRLARIALRRLPK